MTLSTAISRDCSKIETIWNHFCSQSRLCPIDWCHCPVGTGGAQNFFGSRAWGGLLTFRTWCAPGEGEGKGNFWTKFYQNVTWPAGGIVPQKLWRTGIYFFQTYLAGICLQWPWGVRFWPSPQGPGAATPNLTQIFNVFATIVWRSVAAKPEVI